MNRPATCLLLTALLTLPAATAAPDEKTKTKTKQLVSKDVQAFLERWAKSMQDVRSLRVSFTQTKKLRFLRRPLVSKGTTLLKGKRVLMVVTNKAGQRETEILVASGEARIHYPRLRRLEIYPLGKQAAPPTPFPLFGTDLKQLPKTYKLELEKTKDRTVLVLVPRAKGAKVTETRMRFSGTTIKEVVQKGRRGAKVELVITKFEKNPKLDDASLKLETPKGTKVIRVLPRKTKKGAASKS